jgi:hypothetical protein
VNPVVSDHTSGTYSAVVLDYDGNSIEVSHKAPVQAIARSSFPSEYSDSVSPAPQTAVVVGDNGETFLTGLKGVLNTITTASDLIKDARGALAIGAGLLAGVAVADIAQQEYGSVAPSQKSHRSGTAKSSASAARSTASKREDRMSRRAIDNTESRASAAMFSRGERRYIEAGPPPSMSGRSRASRLSRQPIEMIEAAPLPARSQSGRSRASRGSRQVIELEPGPPPASSSGRRRSLLVSEIEFDRASESPRTGLRFLQNLASPSSHHSSHRSSSRRRSSSHDRSERHSSKSHQGSSHSRSRSMAPGNRSSHHDSFVVARETPLPPSMGGNSFYSTSTIKPSRRRQSVSGMPPQMPPPPSAAPTQLTAAMLRSQMSEHETGICDDAVTPDDSISQIGSSSSRKLRRQPQLPQQILLGSARGRARDSRDMRGPGPPPGDPRISVQSWENFESPTTSRSSRGTGLGREKVIVPSGGQGRVIYIQSENRGETFGGSYRQSRMPGGGSLRGARGYE